MEKKKFEDDIKYLNKKKIINVKKKLNKKKINLKKIWMRIEDQRHLLNVKSTSSKTIIQHMNDK